MYIVSYRFVVSNPGWRYVLFTMAGSQVIAPTDTSPTFTDLGPDADFAGSEIYKGVISGLNIRLPPGQYQLRFRCVHVSRASTNLTPVRVVQWS